MRLYIMYANLEAALNLIERLWKFLRQKIISTAFYRIKDQLKTAMLDFFDRTPRVWPRTRVPHTAQISRPRFATQFVTSITLNNLTIKKYSWGRLN